MKTETEKYLSQILETDWLKPWNRRTPINEPVITSWFEAEEKFLSENFSYLVEEMRSRLRRAVFAVIDPDDTCDENDPWSEFGLQWRERFRKQLLPKARLVQIAAGSRGERFRNGLVNSTLVAGWETEFSEYAPSRFFRDSCDWLLNGYLACY